MAIEQIARGYKTQCLLDFEQSFGTAPTSPGGHILPINSFGLNVSRAKNSAATLTGRRDPVEPFDGNVEVTGDIVAPIDLRAFPWWLKLFMGAPTTTGDATPYTHVFKVGDTTPSGIIQCKLGTSPLTYAKFDGCKVSSLSFTTGGDEELTATISIAGRNGTYGETDYNASATPVVLKRLNNFQASLKKGTSTLATVTQVELTIDNGLDTSIRTLGSGGMVYDIPEGIMSVTGTATSLYTSTDLIDEAKANTETALELSWVIDDSNSLTIRMPEVQFQYQGPTVEGPTGVTVEQSFVAYYADATENTCLQVTVKNDVASYA